MAIHLLIRWVARILGVGVILLILAFAFGGAESMRPTLNEAIGLLFFPVGVMVGFVVAWRWEGMGGLISIVSLALFYLWFYLRHGNCNAGPYFFLFTIPGVLHFFNAFFNRGKIKGPEVI